MKETGGVCKFVIFSRKLTFKPLVGTPDPVF